jgi:hypothetical protein
MTRWHEAGCPAELNDLAVAREHLDPLNKVTQAVRLGVSVASREMEQFAERLTPPPTCCKAFLEKKNPCLVYGVACFPPGAPVGIEVIFEVLSIQRKRRR